MKKIVLTGLCLVGLVALPETVNAHGGQYRGPGDVVPQAPGGGRGTGRPSGPTTGGPAGPSAPGPSGPVTPGASGPATGGPAGPAGGGAARTGARGVVLDYDLTTWDYWWEFNKDPFIKLKDEIHKGVTQTGSDDFFLGAGRRSESRDSLRPTKEQITGTILPALKRALNDTEERDFDIISSCMIAMAKIGEDTAEIKLVDEFKPRLSASNQEIRETAALAFGVAGLLNDSNEQLDLMVGLALDNEVGRKASEATEVNERTRSFAIYGLGLAAYQVDKIEVKRKVFEALRTLIDDERMSSRNMRVASLQAMSLLNVRGSGDEEKSLLLDALNVLEGYYMKKLGSGDQLLQSHCPTAIAKLLGRESADPEITKKIDYYKEMFADDLKGRGKIKRSSDDITRSCALALGQMCQPYDDKKSADGKYSELLLEVMKDAKDKQTEYFSILALGQIGGNENRSNLLKMFDKAKSQEKPWVALSLGVFSFFQYEKQRQAGGSSEPETTIGETLFNEFRTVKQPEVLSALAIAMGLNQYKGAADHMRDMMMDKVALQDLAGYLCIGLALMNDLASTDDIREVVKTSTRRPDLLKQAAIALGKLGDKRVADDLQELMKEGGNNLAKLAAISSALGFIGDQRSIDPLKNMLEDTKLSQLSRAFAAVALGGIADKEMLPWNSKIAVNTNYRASVETLTNKTSGILDIL